MKINVIERLTLLNLLPREGNVLDVRAIHQLRLALAPDDGEAAAIEAAAGPDGYLDESSAVARAVKDIEVGPRAFTVVQNLLKDLDSKGKLPEACIGIWDHVFPPEAP